MLRTARKKEQSHPDGNGSGNGRSLPAVKPNVSNAGQTASFSKSQAPTTAFQSKTSALSAKVVTQLKDKEDNPYPEGTAGLTAHHIIPQSVLTNVLKKLSPDQQVAVMANALPDFGHLTISTLNSANIATKSGDSFEMVYDNKPITRQLMATDADVKRIANITFANMTAENQAKFAFDGKTWGQFGTLYQELKQARTAQDFTNTTTVPHDADATKAKGEKMRDMYDAFYQWQSGNLFYGSKRYEEDSTDTLDEDEKYSNKDTGFSAKIKDIYTVLKAYEKESAELPANIVTKLNELTALTKHRAVAAYDASAFLTIDTTAQLNILKGIGMGNRIGLDKTGSSLHKQAVKDKIKSLNVHPLLDVLDRSASSWTINDTELVRIRYAGSTCVLMIDGSESAVLSKAKRFKKDEVEHELKSLLRAKMGLTD